MNLFFLYCRYRTSGLRAPAARPPRGVFHGLDPMKKRMICCTSILKVRIGEDGKKRRNRAFKMSDNEIITILILFHLSGYRTLKAFYTQMICKEWRQHFPVVLSYNRFVEREQMVSLKLYLFLNNCCLGDCAGISIIDSTPIRVCHEKRSRRHKTFRGFATSGKGTMGWFSVSNCTSLSTTAEKSSNGS